MTAMVMVVVMAEGVIVVMVVLIVVVVMKKEVMVRRVMIKLVVNISSGPGAQTRSSISLDQQNTRR